MANGNVLLPMSGVKVIDLTWHLAGPFATRLLADYGADVIKIERPKIGDPARNMPPFFQNDPGIERSGLFMFLNTNKKSVTLNLKKPKGIDILIELIRDADILIENFSPRVMDSLGLGYEFLKTINPKLVMTSISNFGSEGPYKDWKATELTTYAMGGAMINTGHPEKPPLYIGAHIPGFHVGTVASAATAISLLGADVNGKGDHIDIGAFPVWMGAIDRRQSYLMSHQYTGDISSRPWPASALGTGIWQCTDGFFMTAVGAGLFPRMARMIGAEYLLEQDGWHDAAARSNPDRIDESIALIVPWMLERSKAEARDAAQKYGVYGGPVNNFEDLIEDPHFKERNFFSKLSHPETGEVNYPSFSFNLHLEDTDMPERTHAPLLGQHTSEILEEYLGIKEQELTNLYQQEVI